MKKNLTHQFVLGHKQPEQSVEYYDTNTEGRGLIFRVLKSGTKRFEFRYRFAGKYKRYNIGEFPGVSLKNARKKVQELRVDVTRGIDPQAELKQKIETEERRQLQRAAEKTFRQLTKEYEGAVFDRLRTSTREGYKRIIKWVLTVIGDMPVKEITSREITSLLNKKAYKDKSPVMANRMRSRLHSIFEFGKGECVDVNPVADTKRYKGEKTGERTYESDEIKTLWNFFNKLQEPIRSYFKILLLTGQRRTETQYMSWNDIKHVKGQRITGWVWTIPAELSKSNRVHEVYLTQTSLEIIRELKARAGQNPYVFASFIGNDNPISLATIKRAVCEVQKNSGVSDFRPHDLRRTVATHMAEMGVPQDVTEKILNHKHGSGGALAIVYNRYEYQAERQQALNRWSQKIEKILTGESTKVYELKKTS